MFAPLLVVLVLFDDVFYDFFSAVVNLWQGSCSGWGHSAYREGWVCLPRDDNTSSSLLYSKPQKGNLEYE